MAAYLKLTDKRGVNIAPGYAGEKSYEGWIRVISFTVKGGPSAKVADVSVVKSMDNASPKLRRMKDKREDQPCNAVLDVLQRQGVGQIKKYRYNITNLRVYNIVSESGGGFIRANETDVDALGASMKAYGPIEQVTFMCDPMPSPQLLSEPIAEDSWSSK